MPFATQMVRCQICRCFSASKIHIETQLKLEFLSGASKRITTTHSYMVVLFCLDVPPFAGVKYPRLQRGSAQQV